MTDPNTALARAWGEWLRPVADTRERSLDATVADADLRRALLAEAFGGTPPDPDTTKPSEVLERLDEVSWDVVSFAAQRFVWLLPSDERDAALRDFAIAFATFPPPRAHGESSTDAWNETERLRRVLVTDLSDRAARAFLDAARALHAADLRQHALLLGAPLLPGAAREEAIDAALDAAADFPDVVHRGAILALVVLHAPDRLDRAVDRARAMDDAGESLSSMLGELARDFPRERLASVLEAASAVEDEWSRVLLLGELKRRLPEASMARWKELADAIQDEGLKDMLEPAERAAPDAPAPAPNLADATNAWLGATRDVIDTRCAHDIARAVVRFVRETADLRAKTAAAAA